MHGAQVPLTHRAEQQSRSRAHEVWLPVAMQVAQCPLSQTSPGQQLAPPSPQAAPWAPQFWHCPPTQDPLQHSALTVHEPVALQISQVEEAPTVTQLPSQQALGSWAQLSPRGIQLAQRPLRHRPEQQRVDALQGPPS